MDDVDWKRKLTSRKLWTSVAGFLSLMLAALGMAESEAAQVAALVMAGATVVAYVVGEGLVDAAGAHGDAGTAEDEKQN